MINNSAMEVGASVSVSRNQKRGIDAKDLEKQIKQECAYRISREILKLSEQGYDVVTITKEELNYSLDPLVDDVYTMRINLISNNDLNALLKLAELGEIVIANRAAKAYEELIEGEKP